MRQGVIASALIGIGYILNKRKVNHIQYSAEAMAESLLGTGKMKGVVFPLQSYTQNDEGSYKVSEVQQHYYDVLNPILKEKDWKLIDEVNKLDMRWKGRANVKKIRDEWNEDLMKSAPPKTSSGRPPTHPKTGTPQYRVWDAWMHNNHSRGRFKTKNEFIRVFLKNNAGIKFPEQSNKAICGFVNDGGKDKTLICPYSFMWMDAVSNLQTGMINEKGLEAYRKSPEGATLRGKTKQEYYGYINDLYIERTGVKPMTPIVRDGKIVSGKIDYNNNAGVWLMSKKTSNFVVSYKRIIDGKIIYTTPQKESGVTEQRVMLDLNAKAKKVIEAWDLTPQGQVANRKGHVDLYQIYTKTAKKGYDARENLSIIPPYAGWGLKNTVALFEEHIEGWLKEVKKWLPKLRRAEKEDDANDWAEWLVDDSDPSYYGQLKWAVMKKNSWTGKRKEDTRYSKRKDWFDRYMKGHEIDYSESRTGKFRVGVNYMSNADIISKIPPKELQRLIDEYKQEQEDADKKHEAWKKERDSRLKHTIDSMK